MPIRQRCLKCRRIRSLDAKICSCGARLQRHIYLIAEVGGVRRTRTLGRCTRTYAEEVYHKWKAELKQGTTAPPPSLKQICDAHIEKMKAEQKGYWKIVQVFFDRAVSFFGDVPANEITPFMAMRFKTLLDGGTLSPAYVDRHIAMLKAAWHTSLDIPNPFKRVKLNNPDNTIIERLTPEEEARLLKAAEKDISRGPRNLRTLILVGMHTGLRVEQVLSLHVSEVDFDTGLIHVRQKGSRQHTIPMNQTLYDALLAIKPEGVDYYFPNPKTGKPFLRFDKTWKALKKKAHIDPAFRFHGLRHNFATNVLKATGNLLVVSKLLGHTSTRVTEKYAHVLMKDLRDAVQKLDGSQIGSTNSDPPANPMKIAK